MRGCKYPQFIVRLTKSQQELLFEAIGNAIEYYSMVHPVKWKEDRLRKLFMIINQKINQGEL